MYIEQFWKDQLQSQATEVEGHSELTQHGVLTRIVAFGMCDLYSDGQSVPPDLEGAAQLQASGNSGRPGPESSRPMPSPW